MAYQQLHCIPRTAHVPHTCDCCGNAIVPGARYVSLAAMIDGKFNATKTHFEGCPGWEENWDEEHEETRYFHRRVAA